MYITADFPEAVFCTWVRAIACRYTKFCDIKAVAQQGQAAAVSAPMRPPEAIGV